MEIVKVENGVTIDGEACTEDGPAEYVIAHKKEILANITMVLVDAFRKLVDADHEGGQEAEDNVWEADALAGMIELAFTANNDAYARAVNSLRMAVCMASGPFSTVGRKLAEESGKKSRRKTYIAKSHISGLIKIGRSIDPISRMSTLMCGAAEKPELLLVLDADIERELHKRFAKLHVSGEWFRDDGSIAEFITSQVAQ